MSLSSLNQKLSTGLAGGKRWLMLGIFLAFLASYFSGAINNYDRGIWIDCGINIILAVSLNLILGQTMQFSGAHAEFMSVGGYTAASITLLYGAGASIAMQPLLFVGAILAGGVMAALAGLVVGVPSLRLKGDYLAIVTLGFAEIIRVIMQNTEAVGGASGLSGIPKYTTLGWTFTLAFITIYVVTTLVNSTYGRGFLAVSDDEVAASSMGINPVRYKVSAFVIGAFFAGIAGALYAHHKQTIVPTGFDWLKSIDIVVMVILGGMGRTPGVILAAIILTWLPEQLRAFADYRMIIYALIIILLMILRPQGLFSFPLNKKGTKISAGAPKRHY